MRMLAGLLAAAVLSIAVPAAAQPAATLSPAALAFGGQSMETSSPPQALTVTNSGSATLTVGAVTIPSASFSQTNNCTTLPPGASCTIHVAFMPEALAGAINSATEVAATLSVASDGEGSPNAAGLSGIAEKSLVTHYYRSILRRAPDAPGKAFWEAEATRMQAIGANVNETWFSMASFFYFSAEYLAFNRSDAQFVTDLYNTFFNRGPDAGGLAFWTGEIAGGMPREVVLAAFTFSNEFSTFAQGIFGNTAARAEVDVVLDFYRGLLARLPDGGGFDYWVAQFRAAQCAGAGAAGAVYGLVESISSSFATGGEYAGKNRTNAQYVGDLYNSFLRRGGDLGGVSYWISQLDTATLTREQVRQQFIASSEFTGRVDDIIVQGCLPAPIAPAATTQEPSAIGATAATLNGVVNDNRAAATIAFEFGLTNAYGTTLSATPASVGPAAGAVPVSARVTVLACGTTYHYRVTAQNVVGSAAGADQAFTTSPCPAAPTATTGIATGVGIGGAKLNAVVNDNRDTATVSFEYGTSVAYGTTVAAVPATVAAGTGSTAVTASIAGLACGTNYNFRVKAVNALGTTSGLNQAFRTTECASTCPLPEVRCVSASAGPDQEYTTIQAAVNVANPGDTVLVLDGAYAGFTITRSGSPGNPIVVKAKASNAVISSLNAAIPPSAIRVENASYITVEGFRIDGLAGHGLTARQATAASPNRGITFRGNTVSNCTANILVSQLADSLIEDNTVAGSASHGLRMDSPGSDNTTIRGNLIVDSAFNGIYLDSSPGSDAVAGVQTGVVIEGNTITGSGESGIDADGLSGAEIRNNVIAFNGLHGFRAEQGGAAAGPENLRIVNNTIVVAIPGAGRAAIKLTQDLGGHTIFNNILQGVDGLIQVFNPDFKSNRNALVGGAFSLDGGVTVMGLAAWQAQPGAYDVDSITATAGALFVSPASDLRLAGGSPAANAGLATFNSVAAPGTDILAVPRPQGIAPDIGAYESF